MKLVVVEIFVSAFCSRYNAIVTNRNIKRVEYAASSVGCTIKYPQNCEGDDCLPCLTHNNITHYH